MTGALAAYSLGISLAAPPAALAVGLELDPCLQLSQESVRRITELELTTRVVAAAPAGELAALVRVSCSGNDALIRVVDATTGKALERELALTTPEVDVRERAIALAAAELVLTSWMELMLPERARQPPPPKSDANRRRAAAELVRERSERGAHLHYVLALAQTSSTFEGTNPGYGGGLRLGFISPLAWLAADADLAATQARKTTDFGAVRTTVWSVALRPMILIGDKPVFFGVGVGGRLGIARVSGTPDDAETVRGGVVAGTWAGPLAHASVGLKLSHFVASLGMESGYALRGVSGRVAGNETSGVSGVWATASLGFGWTP